VSPDARIESPLARAWAPSWRERGVTACTGAPMIGRKRIVPEADTALAAAVGAGSDDVPAGRGVCPVVAIGAEAAGETPPDCRACACASSVFCGGKDATLWS